MSKKNRQKKQNVKTLKGKQLAPVIQFDPSFGKSTNVKTAAEIASAKDDPAEVAVIERAAAELLPEVEKLGSKEEHASIPSYLVGVCPFIMRVKADDPVLACAGAEALALQQLEMQERIRADEINAQLRKKYETLTSKGIKVTEEMMQVPPMPPIATPQLGRARILAKDGKKPLVFEDKAPTYTLMQSKMMAAKDAHPEISDEEMRMVHAAKEAEKNYVEDLLERMKVGRAWVLPFTDPNEVESYEMGEFLRGATSNPMARWVDVTVNEAQSL